MEKDLSAYRTIQLPQFNPISTIKQHINSVDALEIRPNTNEFLSGAFDQTIALWDINGSLKNPKMVLNQDDWHDSIQNMRFHPKDSNLLYTSGNDPHISVIDLRLEKFIKKITSKDLDKTKTLQKRFHLINNEQYLFTCGFDKDVKMFSLDTKKNTVVLKRSFGECKGVVNHFDITHDNKQLISSNSALEICLYNLESGKLLNKYEIQVAKKYFDSDEEEDNENIFKTKKDDYGFTYKRPNYPMGWVKQKPKKQKDPQYIWSCDFIKGKTYNFLSSSYDGKIHLFDIENGTIIYKDTYLGHTHSVRQIKQHNDGKHFMTSGKDATARLYNFNKNCEAIAQFVGQRDYVTNSLWFDETTVLGSSWDSIVNIYKVDFNYIDDWWIKFNNRKKKLDGYQ